MEEQLNPLLDGKPSVPLLVILSGPSGVGKDSVLMRMRELGFPFHFVVTATDRPQRSGEIRGVDYHFYDSHTFQRMIDRNEFLEYAQVYGHYKGIPKSEVRDALASGKDVILRIDVQGAAFVRALAPEAVSIFLAPHDTAELRQRLQWRRTESREQVEKRIETAQAEMQRIVEFDYVVINRAAQLDEAVGQVRSIIRAEKQRVRPRQVKPDQF